jgi:hypothetical protein
MTLQFEEFPKIPRYKREVCITEKIDGTNAAIVWYPAGEAKDPVATRELMNPQGDNIGKYDMLVQSRTRFITPGKLTDNYGFAGWARDNADDLARLGPGTHYGEWWGLGIQRNYGITEKRFSLFNVHRWSYNRINAEEPLPMCCNVVPVLAYGKPEIVDTILEGLRIGGSVAAPGFMKPEGIIVWHSQSKQYYKVLLENDEISKSVQRRLEVQNG